MMYIEAETNGRSTYHHGDLYRSLQEAALDLIKEGGLDSLSLRKMANRCNVSQTAPYRHFSSKEHLLAVLAERGCEELFQAMQQAGANSDYSLAEQVTRLLTAYVDFAREHSAYFQMIFNLRVLDCSNYPSLVKAISKHRVMLVPLLQNHGLCQSKAEYYANHLWAYVHGMATLIINRQWVVIQGETIESQISNFVSQVFANAFAGKV